MILGLTGHRNKSLGGYIIPNPTYDFVCVGIREKFLELQPEKIISGFALGFDQWAVEIANEMQIPVIAAVPFAGQESRWPKSSQDHYKKLLDSAEEVVIVSPGSYSVAKMYIRNNWIINNSDMLLAAWNGTESGGTYQAVQYGMSKANYKVIVLDVKPDK